MEGKADMFNQPFGLFLLHKGPHIKIIKEFRAALAQIMQQVKIKIACSRAL